MALLGLLHASFTVSDLDASIEWYTNVLGMELVHVQTGDNEYTRQLVGVPGAVIRAAQFRCPGGVMTSSTHDVELVEYIQPRGGWVDVPPNVVGDAHIAFVCADLDAEYRRLTELGVRFYNPPAHITEGANAGGAAAYLSDPDGNTLELLQFNADRRDRVQARIAALRAVP
jgi:catechol 2,3-dioxygenase-like lactoylglutathione lyase family enzyme